MADSDPTQDPTVQALLSRIARGAASEARARLSRPAGATPQSGALQSPASRPTPTPPAVRYGRRRSDSPRSLEQDPALDTAAVALLQSLPADLQPMHLRRLFPRIVNRIAALWDDTAAVHAYIDSLTIDRRGNRQGFPPGVLEEIRALRAHHLRQLRTGRP